MKIHGGKRRNNIFCIHNSSNKNVVYQAHVSLKKNLACLKKIKEN